MDYIEDAQNSTLINTLDSAADLVDVTNYNNTKGRLIGSFFDNQEGKDAVDTTLTVTKFNAMGLVLSDAQGMRRSVATVLE